MTFWKAVSHIRLSQDSICRTSEGPVEGGTDITITGELFHQGAVVIIGGKAATNIQVTSETTIKAKTPANSFGYKDVMVINPDGGQAVLKDGFTTSLPGQKPDAPENLIARCYDKNNNRAFLVTCTECKPV